MVKSHKRIFALLLLLALIGLVDSLAVFQKTSSNQTSCIIGQNCNLVLHSKYSVFLGIPLSWWGTGFYFLLFLILLFLVFGNSKKNLEKLVFELILFGLIFSFYLFYIQLFKLKAFCTYCLISFFDLTLSTIVVFYLKFNRKFLQE